jgi:hypothetical protein
MWRPWQASQASCSWTSGEPGSAHPRSAPEPAAPPAPLRYERLERVVLADGVGHTLFEQYAAHRQAARGDEETGWFLLGIREANQAVVLATLPAGELREASATHVRFNSAGQALGSRLVRQTDRRLAHLACAYTPRQSPSPQRWRLPRGYRLVQRWRPGGSLRHRHCRRRPDARGLYAEQPRPNVQAPSASCASRGTRCGRAIAVTAPAR